MKRIHLSVAVAVAALGASSEPALAAPPASPTSSCVALITGYEATQLAPGSVGAEVSGFATSGPGLGRVLVSLLAAEHLGTLDACRNVEA